MEQVNETQTAPARIKPRSRLPTPETPFLAQTAITKALQNDPAFFEGYDFTGWPLEKVIFPRGCNLRGAKFTHLRMDYASFTGCVLDRTQFLSVRGKGVRLDEASLIGVTMKKQTKFRSPSGDGPKL